MSEHSGTPWAYRRGFDPDTFEVYPTHGGRKPTYGKWSELAIVQNLSENIRQTQSIARLIAAAPDLLDALKALLSIAESEGIVGDATTIPMCRAAIIKAERARAKP